MTSLGCDFTVKFAQTGYQAAESFVKWLESEGRQIHHIEANDSKFYAASFPLYMARVSRRMVCNNHASSNWPLVVSRALSAIKRRFDGCCSRGTLQYTLI